MNVLSELTDLKGDSGTSPLGRRARIRPLLPHRELNRKLL
jgi:hypothetical protein